MSVRLELACPVTPGRWVEIEAGGELPRAVACGACGGEHELNLERLTEEGGLTGCLACGHPELYTQKRFSRATGIAIVMAAAALAPFTWYLSLAAAAAVDAVLYGLAPNVVVCYACRARHHRFRREPAHPRFDRGIDERLKYGQRAVMGKPMRAGGTAGAPEPEH